MKTLEIPQCPYCSKKQSQKPVKSWKYGQMIVTRTIKGTKWGPNITCSRYNCKCGKLFNFYHSVKGKTWTIPKNLKNGDNQSVNKIVEY